EFNVLTSTGSLNTITRIVLSGTSRWCSASQSTNTITRIVLSGTSRFRGGGSVRTITGGRAHRSPAAEARCSAQYDPRDGVQRASRRQHVEFLVGDTLPRDNPCRRHAGPTPGEWDDSRVHPHRPPRSEYRVPLGRDRGGAGSRGRRPCLTRVGGLYHGSIPHGPGGLDHVG